MDILNLSSTPSLVTDSSKPKITIYHLMVAVLGIFTAFWLAHFLPMTTSLPTQPETGQAVISADNMTNNNDIEVGQTYGNINGNFKDSATGIVRLGNINGVGTHILERQGGISQRASLTSSVLDLDLFIDHKVEIKGETNTSDKTSWLLDVGSITVLE